MNNKIMINGEEVVVQTDEGLIKVTGENVSEILLLENYVEYLEKKLERLTNMISSEDYSDMELKEIIKDLWKNDFEFKSLLGLAGVVGVVLPGIIYMVFFSGLNFYGKSLILVLMDLLGLVGAVILGAYCGAKKHKKESIECKKNIEIAQEQKELIEKELAKIPALIKSTSPTITLVDKKIPEVQRLYNFDNVYYMGSNIITLKDEPVSGALRRIRKY